MSQQPLEQIPAIAVARNARHLLVHLDRFGLLPDQHKGLSEQTQRVQVLRVGLEADLQLRERLQAVLARTALQVQLGRDPGIARVQLEMQDAFDHLERVVLALQAEQQLGRGPEGLDSLVQTLNAGSAPRPGADAGAGSARRARPSS